MLDMHPLAKVSVPTKAAHLWLHSKAALYRCFGKSIRLMQGVFCLLHYCASSLLVLTWLFQTLALDVRPIECSNKSHMGCSVSCHWSVPQLEHILVVSALQAATRPSTCGEALAVCPVTGVETFDRLDYDSQGLVSPWTKYDCVCYHTQNAAVTR